MSRAAAMVIAMVVEERDVKVVLLVVVVEGKFVVGDVAADLLSLVLSIASCWLA